MPDSRWIRCMTTAGTLRGVAMDATQVLQEMVDRHGLKSEVAVKGLGEAMMGALLLASTCKLGQRINLNIRGSGKFQQALVDAYPEGIVRGYVVERESSFHLDEVLGIWGTGLLSVLRTQLNAREPHIGTVPLLTGFLAKDLTYYWVQSEQIPSAVGLSVEMGEGRVLSAQAFLVQALPGAEISEVQEIEKHMMSSRLTIKETPTHLLSWVFQDIPFVILEEKTLSFQCDCSWERVRRALLLVGVVELQAIFEEKGFAHIHCDFCSKDYEVDHSMLERLIDEVQASSQRS